MGENEGGHYDLNDISLLTAFSCHFNRKSIDESYNNIWVGCTTAKAVKRRYRQKAKNRIWNTKQILTYDVMIIHDVSFESVVGQLVQ
jgi:hypothetical protein